jgi:hypothetical protein
MGALIAALATACGGHELRAQQDSIPQDRVAHGADDEDGEGDQDELVELADVPKLVKEAALAAVPGLVLERAERETEHGTTLYSLEGTVGGEAVEVEVGTDGKVLEIERGDDEDEDEDNDD